MVPLRLARPQGVVAAGAGDPRLPDPRRHPGSRPLPPARARTRRRSTTPGSSTTTRAASTSTCSPTACRTCSAPSGSRAATRCPATTRSSSATSRPSTRTCSSCRQPLELYFKPKANAFADDLLRVAPDILPPGSVRIDEVWVDDRPYDDFDAEALTVKLPPDQEVRVRVRLVPTQGALAPRRRPRSSSPSSGGKS